MITALVLLFKFRNLETATVSLLSASVTLPLSDLVFLVYVLGVLTGDCLFALLKSWIRNGRRPVSKASSSARSRSTFGPCTISGDEFARLMAKALA